MSKLITGLFFLMSFNLSFSSVKETLNCDLEIIDLTSCEYTGEGKEAKISCEVKEVLTKGTQVIYAQKISQVVPDSSTIHMERYITFQEVIYASGDELKIGYIYGDLIPRMNGYYDINIGDKDE